MTYSTAAARSALLTGLPVIHAAALAASSKKSDHVRGLRAWLTTMQGGLCAGCGRSLAGRRVELCHVNPSSNARTGYEIAPGNVYAGCKACNAYDQGRTGADIVATMVRPDLVQLSHPDRPACLALAGDEADEVANLRDAVAA